MNSFTGFTLFFAALNLSIGAVLSIAFHTFVWPNLMAGAVMAIAAACLHILGSPLKPKARQ